MVPLLRKLPLAQKVSVKRSRGVAVFVSRFQRAPHAGCPLIIRGSFMALSKKMANVGETIIDSRARIPEVPFLTKFHCGAAGGAESAGTARTRVNRESILDGLHGEWG